MILTGPKIEECVEDGSIHIEPFDKNLVGPNSVDLRLHAEMKVYGAPRSTFVALDAKEDNETRDICMSSDGYVLRPGVLYLGRTIEIQPPGTIAKMLTSHNVGGQVISHTSPDGRVVTYDRSGPNGSLASSTVDSQFTTLYEVDSMGRQTAIIIITTKEIIN